MPGVVSNWAPGVRALDPYLGFNFAVEIEGLLVGGFTQVTGLQSEIEMDTHQEGGVNDFVHNFPRQAKPTNLVFTKGLTDISSLWNWYYNTTQGIIQRKNGTVMLLDRKQIPVMWWNFRNALPVRWTGPDFDASSDQVITEAIELVHAGVTDPLHSTEHPDWRAGLDRDLADRLLGRGIRPGLIDVAQASAMPERHQGIVRSNPIVERLWYSGSDAAGVDVTAVPIVYVEPRAPIESAVAVGAVTAQDPGKPSRGASRSRKLRADTPASPPVVAAKPLATTPNGVIQRKPMEGSPLPLPRWGRVGERVFSNEQLPIYPPLRPGERELIAHPNPRLEANRGRPLPPGERELIAHPNPRLEAYRTGPFAPEERGLVAHPNAPRELVQSGNDIPLPVVTPGSVQRSGSGLNRDMTSATAIPVFAPVATRAQFSARSSRAESRPTADHRSGTLENASAPVAPMDLPVLKITRDALSLSASEAAPRAGADVLPVVREQRTRTDAWAGVGALDHLPLARNTAPASTPPEALAQRAGKRMSATRPLRVRPATGEARAEPSIAPAETVRTAPPAINLDQIVDKVEQRFVRRLAIESERRGGKPRWR
jgi:phage tail-like protein